MSTLVAYADINDEEVDSWDGVADDGEGGGSNGTYSVARNGTGSLWLSANTSYSSAGQNKVVGNATEYDILQSFLSFDTSSIGTGNTVSDVSFDVRAKYDNSTVDFELQARLHAWATPLSTTSYVPGADLSAKTLLAHYNTSSGWGSTNLLRTFVDDAFPANVNRTGNTRILVVSKDTADNSAPTDASNVAWHSADYTGTSFDPKLTVTYTAGSPPGFLMLENNSGSYELEDGSGGTKLEN